MREAEVLIGDADLRLDCDSCGRRRNDNATMVIVLVVMPTYYYYYYYYRNDDDTDYNKDTALR